MVQNPLTPTQVKLGGNSRVEYSSAALKFAKGMTGGKLGIRFWNQAK
jgi:hypothetical protein